MKKILGTLSIVLFTLFMSSNASAQQYFTYDGDTFSVLLTYNNDNTKLIKVQFSYNGTWSNFRIQSFTDLEDVEGGGFIYTVLDGKNQEYTIDYYRYDDYIVVHQTDTGGEWRLNRRQD